LKPDLRVWHNQAIRNGTEFTLDGELAQLRRLADQVARFCREYELAAEIEFDLNLVMEELFTNAIGHGGSQGIADAVRIRLEVAPGGVRAEFADRGRAFDPADAPAPDVQAPLAERPAGGLGLHFVRQTMRDIRYERAEGWNRLTMLRPIPAKEKR
jgi:anti-sigma regulatory factor (Ser/Thr protein kinase)